MLRACLGCGELIESGSRCAQCQPPPRKLRGRPWRRQRERVFALKGRTCVYCGNPATEVDHLDPVAAGGGDELANLVPACARCNRRKG